MEQWVTNLLPTDFQDRLSALFQSLGATEPPDLSFVEWIAEISALCRLAFASVANSDESGPGEHEVGQIAATRTQRSRGRPSTTQWAYWAAYIIWQKLGDEGDRPSYKFLVPLIALLLSRKTISQDEVRISFVDIRKEAKKHALDVARRMLKGGLKIDLDNEAFAKDFRETFTDLAPAASMPPMIQNGKIDEGWFQSMLETRSAIVDLVKKHGPLGGRPAVLDVQRKTRLGQVSRSDLSSPNEVIRLGKAKEVPLPRLPGTETKLSMSIPLSHLDGPAHGAIIQAFPVWAHSWHALFVARPVSRG